MQLPPASAFCKVPSISLNNAWSKPAIARHPEIPNKELCYVVDQSEVAAGGGSFRKPSPNCSFQGEGSECPTERYGWLRSSDHLVSDNVTETLQLTPTLSHVHRQMVIWFVALILGYESCDRLLTRSPMTAPFSVYRASCRLESEAI